MSRDPLTSLPHGESFRFVTAFDGVQTPEPSVWVGHGRWDVTGEEWFFASHFPGRPVVPGVLLIESLAQLAGLVWFSRGSGIAPADGKDPALLTHAAVKLRRPVAPPASIRLWASVAREMQPLVLFDVRASVHLTNADNAGEIDDQPDQPTGEPISERVAVVAEGQLTLSV